MQILISLFNTVLFRPLFNALVLLYQFMPGRDFGLAVIILTVLIRLIIYPLMAKSIKSQKMLSEIQPKIQEIQQKHKDDKERQAKEMMALYQKEKANPFGGCLPLLIQLPIMIALYRVFWKGFAPETLNYLYSFVPNPGAIDPTFIGLIDLSQPFVLLAILAGIVQFFQSKMMMPKQAKKTGQSDQMAKFSNMMQKQMIYFFPFFTVIILLNFPSAIALYWIVTALFSIFQQKIIFKK